MHWHKSPDLCPAREIMRISSTCICQLSPTFQFFFTLLDRASLKHTTHQSTKTDQGELSGSRHIKRVYDPPLPTRLSITRICCLTRRFPVGTPQPRRCAICSLVRATKLESLGPTRPTSDGLEFVTLKRLVRGLGHLICEETLRHPRRSMATWTCAWAFARSLDSVKTTEVL